MSVSTLTSPARFGFADALVGFVDAVRTLVVREWNYHTTVAAFERLSDRSLADLGLTRDGIRAHARAAVA